MKIYKGFSAANVVDSGRAYARPCYRTVLLSSCRAVLAAALFLIVLLLCPLLPAQTCDVPGDLIVPGKVGIGTTSPSYKLAINGSSYIVGINNPSTVNDESSRLTLNTGRSGAYNAGFELDLINQDSAPNGQMALMQIYKYDSGWKALNLGIMANNVGIGTTAPGAKLQVNTASTTGPGSAQLGIISNGWWGGQGVGNYFSGWATATNPLFKVESWHGADPRDKIFQVARLADVPYLTVQGGGNIGIGTTTPSYQLQLSTDSAAKPGTNTWTVASDARIKTGVREFTDGLAVVEGIRPVWYQYNGKGGFAADGKDNIGVMAQEIEAVAPYTVSTYKAKLEESDSEDTDLLNFNSHALPFILINAMKEQQAQIGEQQKRIEQLMGENMMLTASLNELASRVASIERARIEHTK